MIHLYGHGDDCIELEGDLYEEFYLPGDGTALIGFSNGFLVRIRYDDLGEWHIRVLHQPPNIGYEIHAAGSAKAISIADNDYSDVLTLKYTAEWAVCGEDWVESRK